jgi:hypothetical protein
MADDPKLIYDQADIPPGMSCAEYRRVQKDAHPTRWMRLRAALHLPHARRS